MLDSSCRHLSLKNYDIDTLTLRRLKVDFKLTIDNVTVYQNFTIVDCLIKNGNIVNISSKYFFSIANLDFDTDLFLGYTNCETLQIIGKIRSSALILNEVKCQNLRFDSLEVLSSLVKMDNIQVTKQLFMLESDFGETYFVDCNFSECRISISFPILTSIKSMNLNFSDDVIYNTEFGEATKKKEIDELMEFYRQLKFNAITQHNHYNALKYYSKEMNWYFKSLLST